MKMKKTLLLLLPCLLMTSCGNSKQKKCEDHIKTHLKSPSSYHLVSSSGYEYEGHVAYRIEFEAENSFGTPVTDSVYVHVDVGGQVECSFCEALEGDSIFYYSLGSKFGERL